MLSSPMTPPATNSAKETLAIRAAIIGSGSELIAAGEISFWVVVAGCIQDRPPTMQT
jgi:hypothetical protein